MLKIKLLKEVEEFIKNPINIFKKDKQSISLHFDMHAQIIYKKQLTRFRIKINTNFRIM